MMERTKKYVSVTVRFDEAGKIHPLEIEYDEGQRFVIDKVLDVRRAACQSAGGVGERYTVQIMGQETYLWFEERGKEKKWFVAAKCNRNPE